MAPMSDCIFCRIVQREAAASVVFEDAEVLAFRDVRPQAPVHILIIPKIHIESLETAAEGDQAILGRLIRTARNLARQEGIAEKGYRLVLNTNRWAGQSVWHIHVHLLGGRLLGWPPG
jgi:histidine triad (HIT) family protein